MSAFHTHLSDVVRLFRAGLGRNPEPKAMDHFVDLMNKGSTFHDVAHLIANSREFRGLHGEEDVCSPSYIRFLYQHGFGRTPDPSGAASMLGVPNRGAALEIVAGSDEAKAHTCLLKVLYPDGPPPQDNLAYRLWLQQYGALSRSDRIAISRHIDHGMKFCPTISLLMLAGHDRVDLLLETVGALENQIYPQWTLQIACPENAPATVIETVNLTARRVPGITVVMVAEALSSGERWQAALNASDGDYCAFIYPGDQLAPDALYAFASEIGAFPDSDLIYCDEDSFDADGQRSGARFKSAWSRELSYVGDFIGQLAVFRRARAQTVGGVRHDSGELARFDLMLRVCEGLDARRIRHLARILYHRGRGPGREGGFPKTRATLQHPSILATVVRHLAETHPEIEIESVYLGGAVWPRIVYPLPTTLPLVSIIVPTKNNAAMLDACVAGILGATDYPAIEVLIADNGSRDVDTLDTLRRLSRDVRVRVIREPGPFNWSAINNAAVQEANGNLLLFLNDDIKVIEPGWLDEMVRQVMQDGVGIVGARLFYEDGSIQHAGIALTTTGARHLLRSARAEDSGYMGQIVLARDLMAVTGACMLVQRTVFEQLGGFDETFPLTCNDVDFCIRARHAGHRVVWTPHASLIHIDGATRGRDHTAKQIVRACMDDGRLLARWNDVGDGDPYVNANLIVTHHHLLLATSDGASRP